MEHAIHSVRSCSVVGPSTMRLTFEDGSAREVELSGVLYGQLYGPLRDPEFLARVTIDPEVHTVVWPNGADFDPATLHDWPDHEQAWLERAGRWRAAPV
ncbi:MAG: DUF2442 domain-containing protein [Dehalococcoidia bacterium]